MAGENESIDFSDMIGVKAFDATGRHIGHLQDVAIECPPAIPLVTYVAIHLNWTDRVGEVALVRRSEDVVLLLPWHDVDELTTDAVRVRSEHPDLPVETAAGKMLVRRDILDKQMVDDNGNRLQRVDDVLMERRAGSLAVAGLKVSAGLLVASPGLKRYILVLKRRFSSGYDVEVIPWQAVRSIGGGSLVIGG